MSDTNAIYDAVRDRYGDRARRVASRRGPVASGEAAAVFAAARVLDDELIDGYRRANLSEVHPRANTAGSLAGQLEPDDNKWTSDVVDGQGSPERLVDSLTASESEVRTG